MYVYKYNFFRIKNEIIVRNGALIVKSAYLDTVGSAIGEDNIVIIAGDTAVAFLDVLRYVLADHLDAGRFRIRTYTTALAALKYHAGAILRIFRIARIIQ